MVSELDVRIVGAAMTRFGPAPTATVRSLSVSACDDALAAAGFDTALGAVFAVEADDGPALRVRRA